MKIRKTIGLSIVVSVSLLLLAGCETLSNLQGNKQDINNVDTIASSTNRKQEEPKVEERKPVGQGEKQTTQKINIETKNNLIQTESKAENSISQTKTGADNILSDTKDNSEEIKYYKVIKVVDGDTIAVDISGVSEIIRLIGINTPEAVDPRKPVECFGIEASNKAKELLSGKLVALEKDNSQDERDKYGRLLRYARTKEGLFYNLEIIKQGYGYEYTYNTPYKYQSEFKEAENNARTKKLGLWADGACEEKNIDSAATIPETPEIKPTETIVKPSETKAQCECSSNKYNCSDFKTQAEAQALFSLKCSVSL